MKNHTKETLVLFTLAVANSPLTIGDIAFRSGVSYNTVKKIVRGDIKVTNCGGYPALYHLAKPNELDEQIIRLQGDEPKEGWATWATKIAPKLTEFIRIDKARLSEDVYKQGMVLEALGTNFILLGRKLQKHSGEPDWFTLIGGDEND